MQQNCQLANTGATSRAIGLFTWDPDGHTRRVHPALALLAIAPYLIGLLVAIA